MQTKHARTYYVVGQVGFDEWVVVEQVIATTVFALALQSQSGN